MYVYTVENQILSNFSLQLSSRLRGKILTFKSSKTLSIHVTSHHQVSVPTCTMYRSQANCSYFHGLLFDMEEWKAINVKQNLLINSKQ